MIGFMFIAAFTPGPNNIMLAASGANFGFTRTIPHMIGVIVGFVVLMLLVGLGLGAIFDTFPPVRQGLRFAAIGFIIYLAWRIATSNSQSKADNRSRPLSFLAAASFQLINPKGIVMTISVTTTFISPEAAFAPQFAVQIIAFGLLTVGAVTTWAGFGLMISRMIQSERNQRHFNIVMALLLIVSIIPVAVDIFT